MINRHELRDELEESLVKALRTVCYHHMKTGSKVVSIDGLFGVTIDDGHTFLFSINEKKGGGIRLGTHEPKVSPTTSEALSAPTNQSNAAESVMNRKCTADSEVNLKCTGVLQLASVRQTNQNTLELVAVLDYDDLPTPPVSVSEPDKSASDGPAKKRRLLVPSPKLTVNAESDMDTSMKSEQMTPQHAEVAKVLIFDGSSFSCSLCTQVFKSKPSGIKHVRFKHFNMGSSCSICARLFRNDTELGDHVVKEHPSDGKHFQCVHCASAFKTKQMLREHVKSQHSDGEGGLQCEQCGKHYKSQATLKEHVLNLHNGGRFGCHLCGQGFRSSNLCRQHLAKKHPYCQECGMSVFALKGHVCSTSFPLSMALDNSGPSPSSAHFRSANFKLNKKSLGDLAKSVVAEICSDRAIKPRSSPTTPLNSTSQNTNGSIVQMKMKQQDPVKMTSQKLFECHPSPGKWTNDDVSSESYDEEMHTPSSSVGYLSDENFEDEEDDCMMMMLCDTCDTEFTTQEDYHAHIIQHPWCRDCGKRVLELAAHKVNCHGPVPVMLRRNNYKPATIALRHTNLEQAHIINID